jgi:CelD/BcsL family acetyltransferase involved in cellulose biosynthesis
MNDDIDVAIIDDARDLQAVRDEWDELAVAAGRPYCSPAWMLAWWGRARTGDARLRTIVLRDRMGVLAIAPFFAQVGALGLTEYRLLGAGISHRIGVLCRPGSEQAASGPLGEALGRLCPRPSSVVWEGIDARDEWPARTASALSGIAGVALRRDTEMGAPTIQLTDRSFETWLDATSTNFRKDIRRKRRQLARAGGAVRRTSSQELETDLATLSRLHAKRWEHRGGSKALDQRVMSMFRDVGGELLGADRFRLYIVEIESAPIAAVLCLAAGASVAFWNSGLDAAHSRLSPARLALLSAVEEAFERGERHFDLGGGEDAYKLQFANDNEPVVWQTAFPRGLRYPLTRAQLLPKHTRYQLRRLGRRLPARRQEQLKRLVRSV